MSEKLVEVFERYDIEILGMRKGRGATILTTSQGVRILEPFRGNPVRLEQEYVLKQLFVERGFQNLDVIIPNREGMLFTCDKYRQPFVLKQYFDGEECDIRDPEKICRAVALLARFHQYGKEVATAFWEAWRENRRQQEEARIREIRNAIENGEELERIAYVYEISEQALERALSGRDEEIQQTKTDTADRDAAWTEKGREMEDVFTRHNRELRKIQRYVLRVKKKSAFENLFLQIFPAYYAQGIACGEMLATSMHSGEEDRVYRNHYGICHGACNQHNILLGDDTGALVHFERFSRGNQLGDLYQFSRKAMEKNHFSFTLLQQILETYASYIPLTEEDYRYMFILFSYPEKFWKIANGYYNANKAFMTPRHMEKLKTVMEQEEEKKELLQKFMTFHLKADSL